MINSHADTIWRSMRPDDLAATIMLAARIHPDYPEDDAIFGERLALAPEGCFVLANASGVHGYLISHPWAGKLSPRLNCLLGSLPAHPESWYLHDLALDETVRGQGRAKDAIVLAEHAARAANLPILSLTATGPARAFWLRQGFTPEDISDAEKAVLASYDPEASFLSRPV
ncbi:GNAT family N-acetyltransferase [Acetobacter orleanensis]|nr:GCN5 family acetyltransferase [Acetobacter orleanensis]